MNKPIVALFSLLFIASAMSLPFSDPSILGDNTENAYLVNKSPSSASSKDVKECDKKCLGEQLCMQNCLKSGKKHDYDTPTATQSTKKPDNSPFKTTITQRLVDGIEDDLDGNIEKSIAGNDIEEDLVLTPEESKKMGRSPSSKTKKVYEDSSSSSKSFVHNEPHGKTGYQAATSIRAPAPSGGYRTTTTKKLVDDEVTFDGDIEENSSNYVENLVQKQSKGSSSKSQSSSSSSASSEKIETRDKGGFSQGVSQRTASTAGGYRTTSTKTLVDEDEDMFDGDIIGNEEEDLIQKTSPPPAPKKVTPAPAPAQTTKNIIADYISTCKNCNGDKTCEKLCEGMGFKFDNGYVNTASQAAPASKTKQTTTGTFKGASISKTLFDGNDEFDADFDEDEE